MKNRIIGLMMALVLLFSMMPDLAHPAHAKETITSSTKVSGSDFTHNEALAKKLDAIFAGNASIYSNSGCTKLVNTALGTYSVPNNGVEQYVGHYGQGAKNSGTSCWIYANGVYFTLFGEALGNGSPGSNSEKLNLNTTSSKKISYENMCTWGVREGVGAQIRVGTHSIVVLGYDSEKLTYIDGNGDGKGLVAVRILTWDEVKNNGNINKTVQYIIQPKSSYMDTTFPGHSNQYIGECTQYRSYCSIKVTSNTAPIWNMPCSDKTSSDAKKVAEAKKDETYTAIGLYKNTADNMWYKVITKNGENGGVGYIFAGNTAFSAQLTDDTTITGVSAPKELKQGSSFSIQGQISTRYQQLDSVGAWVNDALGNFATGTTDKVSGTSYSLYNSTVDRGVKFGSLAAGQYSFYVGVTVTTYYATSGTAYSAKSKTTNIYESVFSVVSNTSCSHTYVDTVTGPTCTEKGYTTHTCSKCKNSYTDSVVDPLGHDYQLSDYMAPQCQVDGYSVYTCSRCYSTETYAEAATGHYYFEEYVEATCQELAKYTFSCIYCGYSYDQYIAAPSEEWSTTKPNGVDEALIESKTEYRYQIKEETTSSERALDGWINCGSDSAWGEYGQWSDWLDAAVSPSDAVQVEMRTVCGYYYYLCTKCGAHMHGYGTNACYKWAGGCGASIPNVFYTVWSTVTWDEANLKDWYGTGKYYAYIDGQLVFKWNSGKEKTQYRSRSREMETVYHFYRWSDWSDWGEQVVEANDLTNVETRTVYRCLASGLGEHQYTAIRTEPTCISVGYTTYTCVVCGDSYTADTVEALGHSYGAIVIEPTCTSSGYTTYTCSVCGDSYVTDEIAATGVCKDEDGNCECDWCGAAMYKHGDMDRDGDVDSDDAIYLLYHTFKPLEYALDQPGDMDGDGDVDSDDAIYLLYHTFKPLEYPLP